MSESSGPLRTLVAILGVALTPGVASAAPPPDPSATPTTAADRGWGESDQADARPPAAAEEGGDPGEVAAIAAAETEREEELAWRRKKHHQARATMISGWTTLGVGYGAAVLVGAIAIDLGRDDDDRRQVRYGQRMFIPFGGPIAAAFESRSVTWGLITTGASAAQIVGLTLGIIGTVRLRKYPNPDEPRFAFSVVPTRRGGTGALRVRF